MNEISTAIASAVEEQGAAPGEISRNVEEASTGTAEVSSNIVGVAQASQQTSAGSSQVLSPASELAMNGERLKRKVDTFLHPVRAIQSRGARRFADAAKRKPPRDRSLRGFRLGGPKRDRTADLHNAIVALSQLSYGPEAPEDRRLGTAVPKSGQKLSSGPPYFKRIIALGVPPKGLRKA